MEENLLIKTKRLGISVIKMTDSFPKSSKFYVITNQIIRSSCSVGANYRSAIRPKSIADFIHKMSIVEEETDETIYWLELLEEICEPGNENVRFLKSEANQILAMVVASIKTAKNKYPKR